MKRVRLWVRALVGRGSVERELEAEVRFHVEKQIEVNIAKGMTAAEARQAALRIFGGVERVKEQCRDARGVVFIETLVQDLRYALRMMRRSPAFTAVAVLSLALGIGANTAIFTLIDAVLIKMLPVKNPEQLMVIAWGAKDQPRDIMNTYFGNTWGSAGHVGGTSFSYPTFQQLSAQNQVLSDIFAFTSQQQVNVSVAGHANMADGQLVSGNYLAGLGVQPIVGRAFTDQDDRRGAEPVAVISFRFWNRRFGLDPSVVGKPITVNGAPFTIIGITPREFFGVTPGEAPDILMPVSTQPQVLPRWAEGRSSLFEANDAWWLSAMGRLKPGLNETQTRASLDVIFRQSLAAGFSSLPPPQQMPAIELSPGSKGLSGLRSEFSQPLFILMTVVGLVLLVASANVANLMLARATARQKETAVRLALGAGRGRLVRQLLTESALLALMGGVLGIAVAFRGGDLLVSLISTGETPLPLDLRPDTLVLGFCAAVSLLTGILFGLAPSLRATRLDLTPALKAVTRSPIARSGRSRLGLARRWWLHRSRCRCCC